MMGKKPEKPERPKLAPFLGWLGAKEAKWLIVEPRKIGLFGGAVFGTLALVFYFVRQLFGHPMSIQEVLIGAFLTFVVGYAGTGLFVVYVLWVGEREIPEEIDDKDRRKSERRAEEELTDEEEVPEGVEGVPESGAVEGESSEDINQILEMIAQRDE
jgi:hypothetical protein